MASDSMQRVALDASNSRVAVHLHETRQTIRVSALQETRVSVGLLAVETVQEVEHRLGREYFVQAVAVREHERFAARHD